MEVVDLFSGCGGLSKGFLQAGFSVKKAVEYDPVIAESYKRNFPNVEMIVDDIKNIDLSGAFRSGDCDIIIGGPPCQGFSMAGARNRHGFIDDPRNYLFKHYFNIVREINPKVFVMENVKGMLTMQNGKIFDEIIKLFSSPDLLDVPYQIHKRIVKAVDFGIPQKRERLIIIGTTGEDLDFDVLWAGVKTEIQAEYPHFFDSVTIADAIGNLPPASPDGTVANPEPQTEYERYLASSSSELHNHIHSKHSKAVIERMKKIRGGENYRSLDEDVKSVHSGSYGRLRWDEQASTITTRFDTPAGGRFIHPAEHRTLTPREAARIQSFPDDFVFHGDKRAISRQIGNAVPPKISYFLARFVRRIL